MELGIFVPLDNFHHYQMEMGDLRLHHLSAADITFPKGFPRFRIFRPRFLQAARHNAKRMVLWSCDLFDPRF